MPVIIFTIKMKVIHFLKQKYKSHRQNKRQVGALADENYQQNRQQKHILIAQQRFKIQFFLPFFHG